VIQDRLASFVVGLRDADLPPEVVTAARQCVVDWFAAALPGGAEAPATLLIEALADELADEPSRGRAMLFPSGLRAPLRTAALINGAASHTTEFDDIYRNAIYHPGTVVIPPALAAAQTLGASGAAFVRAVVAGYEVSNRIGVAVNPAHYTDWHTTATVGHFGAAAAVASLLGLDAVRTAHALATAATMAAGLQQAFRADAMSKPMHAGQAAANGALAAIAAGAGVTGAPEMLEGRRGFGAAMSDDPDWSGAVADLGRVFTIVETTHKTYTSCGHGHAAIDAMLYLRERHGLGAGDVKRITIGTYGAALEVTGNMDPKSAFECKFSTPYCVSVALLTGRVRVEAFSARWLGDRGLRDVMGRIEMTLDAEADAAFPQRRGALVEVETTAGERLSHRSHTRKGDPDNPLSEEELTEKYWESVEPVIGRDAAETLLAALWEVDRLADMAELPFAPPRPAAEAVG
jgi:2-methylcitrate dehydratase PrpD